jgi:hypothetical protein
MFSVIRRNGSVNSKSSNQRNDQQFDLTIKLRSYLTDTLSVLGVAQ